MAIIYQADKHVRIVWYSAKRIPDPNDSQPTV